MAKTALEKQLEKQIKQAKTAQKAQEKEARQAAIREQASMIIKDRPIVNGMRILDETAEEVLQCLLSCDRGEGNRVVFDYDIFPTYLRYGMSLEFEKLVQYGMITGLTLHFNGGWLNLLPPAITYFENKKDLSTKKGETETESITAMNSVKLKKGTVVKTAFDEYTLIKQIGSGGNGRVFSATNKDGENVAIKFVEKNISSEKLKRFKNEIYFCEQHPHPNLVKINDRGYAFLDETDYVFYVMPLYAETLENKISSGIPHKKVLDIFIGLLKGLRCAHEYGTIHRDIKPKNIMFANNSFEPIICDFGIAHFIDEEELTTVETKPGSRMANFQYAAPEQKKIGGNVCPQTDIYAIALILNEMFTGEIPQAAGYKKIAEVNEEYKYLDDLFDLLFKQKPEDRLYPVTTILSELKLLTEQYKRDKEKERVKSVVNELIMPEAFNPQLINLEFKNNNIHFVFNSALPDDWFRQLVHGSYSCSWQMGYDHTRLKKIDKNTIAMPIYGNESNDTIKSLVGNVKQWVATVSSEYSQAAKAQAVAEQRRKEEARLAEINRIEKETKMNSTLNSLLKDLL